MATYRYLLEAVPNTSPQEYAASLKVTERPMYGSSRIGSHTQEMELYGTSNILTYPYTQPMPAVKKRYELTDHLGNVNAVVTGRLLPALGPGIQYQAELVSAQTYEAFGSLLPGRNYSSDSYRWGFNGMEKVDEVYGNTGNGYDFGARMYDPRVGGWLSMDPLAAMYPYASPYVFGLDNPIYFVDPNGMEVNPTHLKENDPESYTMLKNDLEDKTGLTIIEKGDGKWGYDKKVRRDEDGNKLGSRTARNLLKKAIRSNETINIIDASGSGGHGTLDNEILYDGIFQNAIEPSAGITDASTFGPALNLFHELTHTTAMGGKSDPKYGMNLGAPDRIGNRIRRQLGLQQRAAYGMELLPGGVPFDQRSYYVPFSSSSRITILKNWHIPDDNDAFFRIPSSVVRELRK